jgi:signal transduction histidine kinase/CheY-like chemotaxis protein
MSDPLSQQLIEREQTQALHAAIPTAVLTTVALISLLALAHRHAVRGEIVWSWYGAFQLVLLGRLALWWRYRQTAEPRSAHWLTGFRIAAFCSGLLLGVGGWLLYDSGDPALRAFLCIAIVSACFAAMSAFPIDRWVALNFVIGALPLMLLRIAGEGTPIAVYTIVVTLLGTLFLIFDGSRARRGLARHVALRLDASRLLEEQRAIEARLSAALSLAQSERQRLSDTEVALKAAHTEARALADAKARILANMSHEMRSPLAAILGLSERALNPDSSAESVREALKLTQASARHLLEIVNDVLDAARVDAGEVSVRVGPVDPLVLSDHVLGLLRAGANDKGLSLHSELNWPLPSRIRADGLRLKQVLLNLLSNAIKFSDRGAITLELRADRARGVLQFAVRDHGIGMSDEQLKRLFQPFAQGDPSSQRRFAGSGLGLYISRELIERMGGRIEVSSALGTGSQFIVEMPVLEGAVEIAAQPAPQPSPATIAPPERLSGRVLIAEDDELLRELSTDRLRAFGLDVVCVGNGQLAVEHARAEPFDAIVLDMHMPVLDGAGAAQALRAEGFRGPLLALTADVMPESVARHRAAGVDEVLSKPISEAELHAALKRFLPSAAQRAATARLNEKLAEVRARFCSRAASEAQALREAELSGDRDALKQRLHRIKGAAGMFRFDELHRLSRAAERAIIDRADSATIAAHLAAVLNDLDTIRAD